MSLTPRHHKSVKSPALTQQVLPWRFRMIVRVCFSVIALLGFSAAGYGVLDNIASAHSRDFTGSPSTSITWTDFVPPLPIVGLISCDDGSVAPVMADWTNMCRPIPVAPKADWCGTGSVIDDGSSDYSGTVRLGYGANGTCYLGFAYRFVDPPHCVVSERGARLVSSTSTESGLMVTGMAPGGVFDYLCVASGG